MLADVAAVSLYSRHRFPAEVISHAVWVTMACVTRAGQLRRRCTAARSRSLMWPALSGSRRLLPAAGGILDGVVDAVAANRRHDVGRVADE